MGSGHRFAYAITLVAALLIGCSPSEEAGQQRDAATTDVSVLSVYVVNYPLQYFAERIGGDLVQVEFPVPADVDPAYWTPGAAVVAGYQSADIILLNGADYANCFDVHVCTWFCEIKSILSLRPLSCNVFRL